MGIFYGGDTGTQTLDFFHAMEALYQLSYIPKLYKQTYTFACTLYGSKLWGDLKIDACVGRQ